MHDAAIAAIQAVLDQRAASGRLTRTSHAADEPPEPNFDEDAAAERASSREERWLNP
jgi:hypothetical protein